jgi:hypothetical protein
VEQEADGRRRIISRELMMRRQRSLRALLVTAAALAVVAGGALAADDAPPASRSDDLSSSHGEIDRTKIDRAGPGKEWWRDVVARFPNCATLTDGCQSCVPNGETLTCSNPGIACTRTEWRCSAERPLQAQPKDEKPAPKP